MKKITTFIVLTIAINSTIMAQKQKRYKEIKIMETSETINVPADSLWKIVREFQNVGEWISTIDSSFGSGEPEFDGAACSERTCNVHFKGYDKIVEKLTHFDDSKKELAYTVTEGMPGFVVNAGNHWKVIAIAPDQSKASMEITVDVKRFMGFLVGGKMKRSFTKNAREVFNELKIYAETGEVSETKKARVKELGKEKVALN